LGLPVKFILTPGQAADVTQATTLIEGVPIEVVIGDKGYDSRVVVEAIEAQGAEAVIPSRKNCKTQRAHDRDRYIYWRRLRKHQRVALKKWAGEKTSFPEARCRSLLMVECESSSCPKGPI
jgi:hypothetical protein